MTLEGIGYLADRKGENFTCQSRNVNPGQNQESALIDNAKLRLGVFIDDGGSAAEGSGGQGDRNLLIYARWNRPARPCTSYSRRRQPDGGARPWGLYSKRLNFCQR